MEKTISDDEKLRRAIEISQRRNHNNYISNATRVNVNYKSSYKLFKKMFLQIFICLLIYLIFFIINSNNYFFSVKIVDSVINVLNYDIDIEKIYNNCKSYINSKINKEENINLNNIKQENLSVIENKNIENNNDVHNEETVEIENKENEDEGEDKENEDEDKEKTQMEKDAEDVKKISEFQKPLEGKVSSEFGEREATSKIMSSDHKGLDIAAKTGTNIKSAMNGIVEVASQNSEYGKFIKITNGDVMTVYAHCKSLKVKKGENVKIGQTIATVGSTGNSTGPHLHFEIRLSGRYINPRYVIEF